MRLTVAEARELWEPIPGFLNTASYGLPPRPAWEALQAALADWRVGGTSWEVWDVATSRARSAFARLVGVPPDDVAVGTTVSQLLAPVSAALAPGSRVLLPESEFTSLVFPWLARDDVEVRAVPLARLADAVRPEDDLVAFS